MKIHQLFIKKNTLNPYIDDSYFYIIEHKGKAICFDPGIFNPIDQFLTEHNLELVAILNTHHHLDHVGANKKLQKKYNCSIYANNNDLKRIPGRTTAIEPGTTLSINDISIEVIDLKAHTLGLVGFYIEELNALFPGDALFSGGCGRLFEGTASDLHTSMKTISKLPIHTLIYCSHEYTLQNLKFALSIDKENQNLKQYYDKVLEKYETNAPTVPSSLELELKINPFLRSLNKEFYDPLGFNNPVDAIKELRAAKDNFKS